MNGAFAGHSSGYLLPVVSATAKVIDEHDQVYATIAHEVLYNDNPHQVESLLCTHQSLSNPNNAIDDWARCEKGIKGHLGTQSAHFDDNNLSFHFDGWKCFFETAAISEEELHSLPHVYINSQDTTPFQPSIHMNTGRPTTKNLQPHTIPWKHHLSFIPDLVVQKTLKATTQLVPMVKAETQEQMWDHLLTHIPELKHQHINDMACCDTFFSSIPSVRGFNCWT